MLEESNQKKKVLSYETFVDKKVSSPSQEARRTQVLLRLMLAVYAATILGFAASAWFSGMDGAELRPAEEVKNSVVTPQSCGVPGANANSHSLVCQNYGEVSLSKGQVLARTAVSKESQHIFLDLTVHKLSTGWSNILLIGEDKLRQPLIGLNQDGLRVAYSGGPAAYENRDGLSAQVPIGKRFRLHIDREGKELFVFLDGWENLGVLVLEDEDLYDGCDVPIYASKDGAESVSDVTIHELLVCSFSTEHFDAMCAMA